MNFTIENKGEISAKFLSLDIKDFTGACTYVAHLPYRRNAVKSDLACIFQDSGGTCSTKHAVLRKLALENNHPEVQLMLAIFKMNAEYAPKICRTLDKFGLKYIPEAHNYLKIGQDYLDFTLPASRYEDFKDLIVEEQPMEYDEIATEKVSIHQNFLKNWIADFPQYDLGAIWKIREQCIVDLQE